MAKQPTVLILSSDLDFASDRVCRELASMDVQFLRLNREQLPEIEFVLDPLQPELRCRYSNLEFEINTSLQSVWWRQGTFDRNMEGRVVDIDDQLERSQWSAFMRSLMIFEHAKWINNPAITYRAETKSIQLLEAKKAGFIVPLTMMTNDKTAPVEDIIGNTVAIKSIDTMMLRRGDSQLFAYTNIVEWSDISDDKLVQAPLTVQQMLEPKLDLRVTILADIIWCVEISKMGKNIGGDWRLTKKSDLIYDDHDLPGPVRQSCLSLMKNLGLVYGAIDLAVVNGSYFFIEINPTGEWGWLDSDDRNISKAIARELAA